MTTWHAHLTPSVDRALAAISNAGADATNCCDVRAKAASNDLLEQGDVRGELITLQCRWPRLR